MDTGYYKSKASVDEYIKMAEGHNGSELIDLLKKYLPLNATILEIGSGPGTDWEILNNLYNVTGSDNSPEFLKRLSTKYPNGHFIELDANSLSTDKKFDGIYSNKVLHHLNDDQITASMKNQHKILNPQGIICHSFWRGEDSEVFNGLFVNYLTEDNIKHLFGEYFTILLMKKYKEFEQNDSIVVVAKKLS